MACTDVELYDGSCTRRRLRQYREQLSGGDALRFFTHEIAANQNEDEFIEWAEFSKQMLSVYGSNDEDDRARHEIDRLVQTGNC